MLSRAPNLESSATAVDDWWKLYEDPLLDSLIEEAFAANTDLTAAQANLSAARAVLEASRAGRYPTTTVGAGAIYGHDPTTEEILEIGGHAPQTVWLFDDILDASYELDLFGHVRRSIEASKADAQAAAAARDDLRVTVAAETARAYAEICTLGEQLAVAHRSLDVVSRESRITTDRHEAGGNSSFDVVRAEGLVSQVHAGIPSLEGRRRAALFQLADLLGRTPSRAPADALACVTPPRPKGLIPIGDGTALLKRRPDVREAERRLASATARIGVATADLYPRIKLEAFYGGATTSLSQLTTEGGLIWGAGPAVSWAFPIQAGPRARVRQAKANASSALANFDSVVLKALKETEQALTKYNSDLAQHDLLVEADHKADQAFTFAHDQFLAGSISTLELLTTERTLVDADASTAASDATLADDQILVFKTLGGGWRNSTSGIQKDR